MIKKLIITLFYRSWWVIGFGLLCAILYEKGLKAREYDYRQLKQQLTEVQLEKEVGIQRQKRLKMQIASQTDDEWKELVLKRVLGLVSPEEQKVYFYKDPTN